MKRFSFMIILILVLSVVMVSVGFAQNSDQTNKITVDQAFDIPGSQAVEEIKIKLYEPYDPGIENYISCINCPTSVEMPNNFIFKSSLSKINGNIFNIKFPGHYSPLLL